MQTVHHTQEDLIERRKVTAAVFTGFLEKQELANGYALRYPHSEDWNDRLTKFAEIWRKSCPYFNFELTADAQTRNIWLRITGPEGTKRFVDNAHEMLTSYLNPAPNGKFALKWRFANWTSRIRVLPDFLIIGAKKCGTTSLYAYLTQHPCVKPAFKKEVYFFNGHFKHGLASYRANFPTAVEKFFAEKIRHQPFITGEASPEYILSKKAAKRVYRTLPHAKLIAILRNPIDKAYSLYQHQLRSGLETLPFEEVVESELAHLQEDAHYFDKRHSYLVSGIYAGQLKVWRRYFPEEQFLILTNEALNRDPANTVAEAFAFLGLPAVELKKFKKLNAYPYPEMEAATRARLAEFFAPHNRRLYEMLGRDLGWDG